MIQANPIKLYPKPNQAGWIFLIVMFWLPLNYVIIFLSPDDFHHGAILQLIDSGININYRLLGLYAVIYSALLAICYIAWQIISIIRHSKTAVCGTILVMLWLIVAIAAPILPIRNPNTHFTPFIPPFSFAEDLFFIFGTDHKGRDMLARTLWGCQRTLVWSFTATFVAYLIGICAGLIAGYKAGWWDEALSFIANVLLSFPIMVLFILILYYLGTTEFNIIIAVTVASGPGIMRIVRGLTLDIKAREFVLAAQVRGEKIWHIMLIEILPNIRQPLIVDACLRLGYTSVAITSLTFLGLGLQPPDPDWGLMIKEARNVALIFENSYMLLLPAISVSSVILGLNLLADGWREWQVLTE